MSLCLGPILFANFVLFFQILVLSEAASLFAVRERDELEESFLEHIVEDPRWKFVYGEQNAFSETVECPLGQLCEAPSEIVPDLSALQSFPDLLEEFQANYLGLVPAFFSERSFEAAQIYLREQDGVVTSFARSFSALLVAAISFSDREAFSRAQLAKKESLLRKERLGKLYFSPEGARIPLSSRAIIPVVLSSFHFVSVLVLLSFLMLWSSSNVLRYFEQNGIAVMMASSVGAKPFMTSLSLLSFFISACISLTFLPAAFAGFMMLSGGWIHEVMSGFQLQELLLVGLNLVLAAGILIMLPQSGILVWKEELLKFLAKYAGASVVLLSFFLVLRSVLLSGNSQQVFEFFCWFPLTFLGAAVALPLYKAPLTALSTSALLGTAILIFLTVKRRKLFRYRLLYS